MLLAELRRIGADGRRNVIVKWAPFMPNLIDDSDGTISMAEPEDYTQNVDDGSYLLLSLSPQL